MAAESTTHPALAFTVLGLHLPVFPNPSAVSSTQFMASLPEYVIDALQRSVLFLDLLRQRGNEQIEITSRPMATVLDPRSVSGRRRHPGNRPDDRVLPES